MLSACTAQAPPHAPVTALPVADLVTIDGRDASLQSAVGGSVAVVDLWATWCAACQRERPKLERLYGAFAARGLRVVGVNVGEEPSVVVAYLAENHVPYPNYLDPAFHLADALGERRVPAVLVIDRGGRIVHRSGSLDRETLESVEALLPP